MSLHPPSVAAATDVVVFEIESRRLGVESDAVRELVRAVAVTPLPGAPAGVDGVIDVRGTLVPVFDLRPRLGLAPSPLRASEQLVLCQAGTIGVVALRADRILEIRPVTERLPVPAASSTDALATAIVRLPDGVVVLCDLQAILQADAAAQLAQALAEVAR